MSVRTINLQTGEETTRPYTAEELAEIAQRQPDPALVIESKKQTVRAVRKGILDVLAGITTAALLTNDTDTTSAFLAALGLADDGALGPLTMAAVHRLDAEVVCAKFCGQRLEFMSKLSTWDVYGKGWARRVADQLKGL